MHLVMVAEAPEGIIPRFEKWLHERIFRTPEGRGKSIRIREFKFYDLVYPREIHDEVVGTLKNIEHSGHLKLNKNKAVGLLKKMFGSVLPKDVEIIDTDKFEKIPTDEFSKKSITAKVLMLATIKDEIENDLEML